MSAISINKNIGLMNGEGIQNTEYIRLRRTEYRIWAFLWANRTCNRMSLFSKGGSRGINTLDIETVIETA